mmetsp:Transcript_17548/g.59632  ORF Transcript_17548/g.59632 Transcript_17548/m.59632 type:complete len:235 (+) Transcript_17548:1032-1736(+)
MLVEAVRKSTWKLASSSFSKSCAVPGARADASSARTSPMRRMSSSGSTAPESSSPSLTSTSPPESAEKSGWRRPHAATAAAKAARSRTASRPNTYAYRFAAAKRYSRCSAAGDSGSQSSARGRRFVPVQKGWPVSRSSLSVVERSARMLVRKSATMRSKAARMHVSNVTAPPCCSPARYLMSWSARSCSRDSMSSRRAKKASGLERNSSYASGPNSNMSAKYACLANSMQCRGR